MWRAFFGTVMLVLVMVTSLVIVKRRLRYEAWFLVHLLAYMGIALSWPHQLADGNEFVVDSHATLYWSVLYFGTLGLAVLFRLGWPLIKSLVFNLRVHEVVQETENVYSIVISGRWLDRLGARAGQFFLWRFLTWGRFWQAHPFSLSSAPDGKTLRITVKHSGDFTRRIGELKPGTRILVEGPFGVFTDAVRRREKLVMIAGGIGISPIRSLLEETAGDAVLLYRAVSESDLVFRDELDSLALRHGTRVHYLTGDFRLPQYAGYLSTDHLEELVPDVTEREAYVCGPPLMMAMVEKNLRAVGVPRRHIHRERFAL
jgi:predicted ferric reductase